MKRVNKYRFQYREERRKHVFNSYRGNYNRNIKMRIQMSMEYLKEAVLLPGSYGFIDVADFMTVYNLFFLII